jgi:hypothetical protein
MKNAKLYNSPLLLSGKRSDLQLDKHKITNIRGEREIDIAFKKSRITNTLPSISNRVSQGKHSTLPLCILCFAHSLPSISLLQLEDFRFLLFVF